MTESRVRPKWSSKMFFMLFLLYKQTAAGVTLTQTQTMIIYIISMISRWQMCKEKGISRLALTEFREGILRADYSQFHETGKMIHSILSQSDFFSAKCCFLAYQPRIRCQFVVLHKFVHREKNCVLINVKL